MAAVHEGKIIMGSNEELIYTYLDKNGIKRKWKGYRILYELILLIMNDPSLDCNTACEKIRTVDEFKDCPVRTIYSTSLYALKNSKDCTSTSVFQFVWDGAMEVKKQLAILH